MNAPITRREMIGVLGALALPFKSLMAEPTPAPVTPPAAPPVAPVNPSGPPPPDLANLDGLMQSIARENAPRFSFLEPQWRELEAWKQAARPVFHRHLSYHPAALPL